MICVTSLEGWVGDEIGKGFLLGDRRRPADAVALQLPLAMPSPHRVEAMECRGKCPPLPASNRHSPESHRQAGAGAEARVGGSEADGRAGRTPEAGWSLCWAAAFC